MSDIQKSKFFCIKSYCKFRAWKQVAQWLLIGATSIMFLGTFAVCDAYAAAEKVDISGETTVVDEPDEKTLDFDADPGTGTFEPYSAKLYFSGNYTGVDPDDFELRGWVWNENFGWISLYCGANGQNQGIPCGNKPYGIKVDLSNEGRMYGWAWGDNIGWISFNCEGGLNDTFTCGSTEYGAQLAIEVDLGLGEIEAKDQDPLTLAREPMAWTDTVGKFALNGIGASILDLMINPGDVEAPYGIWTKVENPEGADPNTPPSKLNMPAADGTEGYDLFVNVADILGNPIDPSYVTIDTTYENSIQRDQTIDDTSVLNLDSYEKTAWAPSTLVTSGLVSGAYHQKITSEAPSDEGNCYDPDDDGCDFYYKTFADEEEDIGPQNLKYTKGDVTVKVGTESVITPLNFVPSSTIEFLEFAAPVDIDTLGFVLPGYPDPIGVIQATRNAVDTFKITSQKHGNPLSDGITLELTSLENDVDYNFIENIDDNPFNGDNIKLTAHELISLFADNEIYAIPFTPVVESSENLSDLVAGAELRSTIFIDTAGEKIKYYNNGLPRTAASEIINQTVEILSGSVFSPGAIQASSEADVTLYGDAAVYGARTAILKNVSDLVRGGTSTSGGIVTINDSTAPSLTNYALKNNRLYYFKDTDVHLESINALAGYTPNNNDPVTILLQGGDLYVDGNINEDPLSTPTSIGLIVLESTTDEDELTKGGHIYVHSDVTDMVEVSIFADGPMYRYTSAVCFNATDGLREPNFVDVSYGCGGYVEPIAGIPNQFYLKGNVATMNCLGCSVSAAPTRGNGTLIGDPLSPTAKDFAIARLYDFNYFSYFRFHPELDTTTGALSQSIPAAVVDKNRPVYIEYSPSPSGMFGFSR